MRPGSTICSGSRSRPLVFLLVAFLRRHYTRPSGRVQAQLGPIPTNARPFAHAIIAGLIGGRAGYIFANAASHRRPSKMLDDLARRRARVLRALLGPRCFSRARIRAALERLVRRVARRLCAGTRHRVRNCYDRGAVHGLFAGGATVVPWGVQMFLERRHPTKIY